MEYMWEYPTVMSSDGHLIQHRPKTEEALTRSCDATISIYDLCFIAAPPSGQNMTGFNMSNMDQARPFI